MPNNLVDFMRDANELLKDELRPLLKSGDPVPEATLAVVVEGVVRHLLSYMDERALREMFDGLTAPSGYSIDIEYVPLEPDQAQVEIVVSKYLNRAAMNVAKWMVKTSRD